MKRIKLILALSLVAFAFVSCSKKQPDTNKIEAIKINPLGRSFGAWNDNDPLRLGAKPTPPVELERGNVFKEPFLVDGKNIVPATPLNPPIIKPNPNAKGAVNGPQPLLGSDGKLNQMQVFENRGIMSEYVGIMGAGGELLTVWALASGNWIWGYTHINSKSLGNARIWRVIEYPKNFVMFKNVRTGNCLTAYRSGTVHYPCDPSNQSQFWELKPMSNQAMQIKNLANGKCLQSKIDNPLGDFYKVFEILTDTCVKSGVSNLDQQWYLVAPTFAAKAIIIDK